MAPRFRHVIFDLDGTLADTGRDLANAANHVRRAHGLEELAVAAVCNCVGEGARRLVARVLPDASPAEIDEALPAFLRYYDAHLLDETTLYPGIATLLSALDAEGVTCSVLSNKPDALCRRLVDGLGVSRRFAAVLGGDSLAARKPDPCGIHQLEIALRVAPSAMLLVGDSPIDRDTAGAAGIAFCGVAWGFASHALRAESGMHLASTPDDILSLVVSDARPVR